MSQPGGTWRVSWFVCGPIYVKLWPADGSWMVRFYLIPGSVGGIFRSTAGSFRGSTGVAIAVDNVIVLVLVLLEQWRLPQTVADLEWAISVTHPPRCPS